MLERDGYEILENRISGVQVRSILRDLSAAFGEVHAVRNLLQRWPGGVEVVRSLELPELRGMGVVRSISFDKPPRRSWSVGWHKDLTIAVREADESMRPTVKSGVPHIEAPLQILQAMLTVRVHLDPMGEGNGPLRVVPGSHREGKSVGVVKEFRTLRAGAGDVLLMRPLLTHSSPSSDSSTLRRRVLHFECAPTGLLPGGLEWFSCIPI